MLVLSRKVGEVVCIGDNVEVKIVQSSEGRVRLAITAPADVKVLRKEIRDNPKPKEATEK